MPHPAMPHRARTSERRLGHGGVGPKPPVGRTRGGNAVRAGPTSSRPRRHYRLAANAPALNGHAAPRKRGPLLGGVRRRHRPRGIPVNATRDGGRTTAPSRRRTVVAGCPHHPVVTNHPAGDSHRAVSSHRAGNPHPAVGNRRPGRHGAFHGRNRRAVDVLGATIRPRVVDAPGTTTVADRCPRHPDIPRSPVGDGLHACYSREVTARCCEPALRRATLEAGRT